MKRIALSASSGGICRLIVAWIFVATVVPTIAAEPLKLLFLGDNGHHRPEARFQELAPVLQQRGVLIQYTDRMTDLTPAVLNEFDGLVLYANIDRIEAEQAQSVLDFVSGGKGFIPLHCATYCWRNNADIVALMGGQFLRHGGQVFTTKIAEAQHPIMKGYHSFTSWDETYIHHLHNEQNRTVLEYRIEGEQAEGNSREPWTWVRTHGKGRVFYTAWGHDQRTFSNPGFHNLVERGIRWACGDDPSIVPAFQDPETFTAPEMTPLREDVAPFDYVDVGPKIPNYTPGARWGVQGEARTTMQQPLTPEESIKHFVTPRDMAVRLWADERSFQAKPISMTWDERGRLWICETLDYPNELGENRDRIRICEDTDRDGRADKFTIFAEGLSIPTAILIYRGGAVVQNGTETIYLKDTTGDGQADVRTTLISGWALGDTHGGVSNFRYGLDNWVWAMQGYNSSTPVYNGKTAQSFRMGFWRFKLSSADPPVVTDLEFIRSTNNNTWGLGISEEGLIFGSTANHNPSTFMPIENHYYEKVRGWAPSDIGTIADTHLFAAITENVRQVDQFGGYTAGAGHALYTARTFPRQWWNRTAFVCEPTGHLVGTFVLRRNGSAFQSTSPTNLLASNDEWSSPIAAEVGPDGSVWVLDWYNFIIQHNPTPQGFENGRGNAYESDLRDKRHGRIYRVVPTSEGGDVVHAFESLVDMSDAGLVETLKHPSMIWRLHAQRLLIERSATAEIPRLLEILQDKTTDEIGLNVAVIHAMWVLAGLAETDATANDKKTIDRIVKQIGDVLDHPSAGARRNAVAVLGRWPTGHSVLLQKNCLTDDQDAQVRLRGILAIADMPAIPEAGHLVARLLAKPGADRWELDALTSAAASHALYFLESLATQKSITKNAAEIADIVSEHISRGRPSESEIRQLTTALIKSEPLLVESIIRGLVRGWPKDHRLQSTEELNATYVRLFKAIPGNSRGKLLQLAALSGSEALRSYAQEITSELLKTVTDSSSVVEARVAAAKEAVGFQPESSEVLQIILEQLSSQADTSLSNGLLEAASLHTSKDLGTMLPGRLAGLTPQTKSAAVRVLLSRPGTTIALLNGIQAGTLTVSDLSLDQKQAMRSHPNAEIRKLAEAVLASDGGLPDPDRDQVLRKLVAICDQNGDVAEGRAMFVKHCSKCHMHGSEGKTIGPNLTGMAVHPKQELLTHIIDPSRSVEGNFRIYTVVLSSGLVINGMMTSETRTSITLLDTEAKEHSVPREDIDELISSRKSVMPEGFEKQMSKDELASLLQFLTDKGRFLPVSLDRYATAISTKGLFHEGDNGPDRMLFADWSPKVHEGVPFVLTDPRGKSAANIILLNGPNGTLPPRMPRSVSLPCNSTAVRIHMLSGVGGWSYPAIQEKSVSMIVRLHYAGGRTEDHELRNGVHFADYIRRVDVPQSQFAFALGGQQIRRLTIVPGSMDLIERVELIKGPDASAPIIMAVTVERP